MDLKSFGFSGGRRKTLVVLGAGASRGAGFVTSRVGVLPPLDADFFQQLSRVELGEAGSNLLEFVRAEYGHEAGLSMERFFSEADYTSRFHRELNVDPGPRVKRYERALADFYRVAAELLSASTSRSCGYHAMLASLLHVEDTVLSFNYDCIMDRALLESGGNRWDPDKPDFRR